MLPTPATVFYRRAVGLVTAAVLAVLLWRIVEPFLAPLAWAVFLAFLLQPLQVRLARRLGGRESLAALLLTLLTLLLFVGPLGVLGALKPPTNIWPASRRRSAQRRAKLTRCLAPAAKRSMRRSRR